VGSPGEQPPDNGTLIDTGVNDGKPSRRDAGLELGRVFGRYVVLQHLGSGGAGSVYAAYDPDLDRKIALKVLNDNRPRARQRLVREAQAIAKVRHPNIVAVHDVGTYEGRVYIAMEFVDGMTLRRWIAAEERRWPQIVDKVSDAGAGLAAAHDAGLVHRDFKPENVLVDTTGRVFVLDFGLARRASTLCDTQTGERESNGEPVPTPRDTPLDVNITGPGALMGTPAYMAPEQHLRRPVDARTDQFAFCIVAWEALFGERPFAGASPAEMALSATGGMIVEPRKASAAPVAVRRVLKKGLSPSAGDRYSDMRTLLGALARDPRRSRRALLGGVALAAAAAAAGGYATTLGGTEDTRCDQSPERWAGIWDDARRARIADAFARTDLPYAERTFNSVASVLDAHVERWNTAHREACEATVVHALQPRSVLELRWACLGRRRGEMAALVDELIVADDKVVAHAVEAARQLRPVDSCADADSLIRRPPLPTDADTREQVVVLRDRLVDARAKALAARYPQAIAMVRDVIEQAEALSASAVAAEAKLALGAVLEATGQFVEARRWILEAIWDGEASGHEQVVAQAWVRLVWVVGVELHDTERGTLWTRFAQAAVTRAGSPSGLHAQLMHNVGGVLYRQERLPEAFDHYSQALTAQQALFGSDDPRIATTLNHLANTLSEMEQYSNALEYARRSLVLRERVLGSQHPKVAAALNNIAEVRRAQGNYTASLAIARKSLAVVEGSGGAEEIVALDLVGTAAPHLGLWPEARASLQRVVVLREEALGPTHPILAPTLRALALVHQELGEDDTANAALRRASEIEALEPAVRPEALASPAPLTPGAPH